MKSLPLAYNKDLQEDKEGVIDAAKTLYDCLTCMEGMIATMKINKDAMRVQAEKGYLAATDVADYLAKRTSRARSTSRASLRHVPPSVARRARRFTTRCSLQKILTRKTTTISSRSSLHKLERSS